jgi:hypothetical protein
MFCRSLFVLFLLAIVLSVHLRFTVLITSLIFFGHCIVCPSSIYRFDYPFDIFWPLHCLSIFNLPFDYPFDIFWPLYCLSIFDLSFWLPLWYLLAIVLSVHLRFTALITLLYLLAIVLSVHLQLTVLITPLVSFGHSVVCPSSIYRFYTPLISFSHSVVCPSSIYRFYYPFDIFSPLYCLSIFNLPFWLPLWYLLATLLSVHLKFTVLITPLVSWNFSSYARACSLYSKILQRHHILSNKLLNRWFLKNRFIFQNVLQISTPCWKAFCQLCTGDENGIVNYILI